MFFNFRRLKTGAVVVLAMLSMPVAGQDLLARQAPIDKKMRAVDSVALQRLIGDEQLENPAFGLYPDWNNQYAHRYDVELPEEYKIDLRHFCMPTPSTRITSNYGYRASFRRQHKGLDIKVYIGDTIRSAFSGKVRIVDYERKGYGNYVVIRHPNGLETIYGHLHFETRFLGQAINPAEMFDFVAQDVTGDYYIFRSNKSKGQTEVAKNTASARPKPTAKPRSKVHRVKSGENLSVIASKYGTTVAKLCKLNGISRKTMLRPGQIIKYS